MFGWSSRPLMIALSYVEIETKERGHEAPEHPAGGSEQAGGGRARAVLPRRGRRREEDGLRVRPARAEPERRRRRARRHARADPSGGRERQGGAGCRRGHAGRHREDEHLRYRHRGVLQAHRRPYGILRRAADEHHRRGPPAGPPRPPRRGRGDRGGGLTMGATRRSRARHRVLLGVILCVLVLADSMRAHPQGGKAAPGDMRGGRHVSLAARWIVPKKYVEKVGDDGFKAAPIGAGPYKVVSFKPGIEIVLEAFDGYWRKAPAVKRLVMRSMPEEATRAAALRAGEVDIVYLLTGPTADAVRKVSGFRLAAPLVSGAFWIELPEQWDPKSPWADQRVRLAASHAIDRAAINQAEMLGFGRLTGNFVPRIFQFAVAMEPAAYDPAKAKKLLAEAGYPSGFDAGDFYPFPPYDSMGEAILGNFQAVGIKSRLRTMERAAYFTAWRDKKLHGVIHVITAAFGNAATRLEPYVTKSGVYAYGSLPEIDDLYIRQARELDAKKREALVHQIQQIIRDKVMAIPLFEQAFIWGVGPRVAEAGDGRIPGFGYSAPFEDLRLKEAR